VTFASKSTSQRSATSAKVRRGETGSSPRHAAACNSSRCLRASASVPASSVRKRACLSTITQTAYVPFDCR